MIWKHDSKKLPKITQVDFNCRWLILLAPRWSLDTLQFLFLFFPSVSFQVYDLNNDGVVSRDELFTLLRGCVDADYVSSCLEQVPACELSVCTQSTC